MSEEPETIVFEEFATLITTVEPQPCHRCQAPTRLGISLLEIGGVPPDDDVDYYYSLCLDCLEHFIDFMVTRILEEP